MGSKHNEEFLRPRGTTTLWCVYKDRNGFMSLGFCVQGMKRGQSGLCQKNKMVSPSSKFHHHSPNSLLQIFPTCFCLLWRWKIINAMHCAKDWDKVCSLVVGTSNFIDNFGHSLWLRFVLLDSQLWIIDTYQICKLKIGIEIPKL